MFGRGITYDSRMQTPPDRTGSPTRARTATLYLRCTPTPLCPHRATQRSVGHPDTPHAQTPPWGKIQVPFRFPMGGIADQGGATPGYFMSPKESGCLTDPRSPKIFFAIKKAPHFFRWSAPQKFFWVKNGLPEFR